MLPRQHLRHRFSDDATSIVILLALSDFAKGGRRLGLKPVEGSLSPFSVPFASPR
jgi:hypothetical protein